MTQPNDTSSYRRRQEFSVDGSVYKYDFRMDADSPGSVLDAIREDVDTLRAEGYSSFQITLTDTNRADIRRTGVSHDYAVQIYANGPGR